MSNASKFHCVYCGSAGPFTDEHVLARAFAGPNENWMLKDLVCAKCNNLFSTYERAWTSAPGEAYARIHWGPAGWKRKGAAYQAHPSENIFLMINGDPILYEADILRGSQPRLRPQIILTRAYCLWLEMLRIFRDWTRRPSRSGQTASSRFRSG
jgi:hypothetical protein